MTSNARSELITNSFANRMELSPKNVSSELRLAITTVYQELNTGKLRVAEKINDTWVVYEWIKQAILLSFRIFENNLITTEFSQYFDKIPSKYQKQSLDEFNHNATRLVPPCYIRDGVYIAKNCIIMPSFINIGAYIDTGTMIDIWATIGSCAQIGKNVHIADGAGIGGVLEPAQARPTIIEDNCFIGAKAAVVEGMVVGAGSVIAMGVHLGQSTKIYDRETDQISYGFIPPGSVVIPGSLASERGNYNINCAIIAKKVDAATRAKVAINDLLRMVE